MQRLKNDSVEYVTLKKDKITDFAEERNELLFKAKSKWVFFLDSDEKLIGDLSISDRYSGYKVRRDNYFLGQFVGSDWIVRLAKRSSGKWVRRVHEIWNIEGKIGVQKAFIVHNTASNLKGYIDKLNFYSDLHAQANKEEGKRSTIINVIFFPCAKFIQTLIKSKNVVFSITQAFHSFLAWSKLYFSRS